MFKKTLKFATPIIGCGWLSQWVISLKDKPYCNSCKKPESIINYNDWRYDKRLGNHYMCKECIIFDKEKYEYLNNPKWKELYVKAAPMYLVRTNEILDRTNNLIALNYKDHNNLSQDAKHLKGYIHLLEWTISKGEYHDYSPPSKSMQAV
jgi:hypothetical protein